MRRNDWELRGDKEKQILYGEYPACRNPMQCFCVRMHDAMLGVGTGRSLRQWCISIVVEVQLLQKRCLGVFL